MQYLIPYSGQCVVSVQWYGQIIAPSTLYKTLKLYTIFKCYWFDTCILLAQFSQDIYFIGAHSSDLFHIDNISYFLRPIPQNNWAGKEISQ